MWNPTRSIHGLDATVGYTEAQRGGDSDMSPRTYSPEHFPLQDNSPSRFTSLDVSRFHRHHYTIKLSTINVYKTDGGRSVHHHHQVARPAVSIAVSTTARHLEVRSVRVGVDRSRSVRE